MGDQQQQQDERLVVPREDASYRSDLRDLRSERQRLLNHIKDLTSSKDSMRMQACEWRKKAEAAVKALEVERRAEANLTRTRESLRAAADDDRKTIARLQAQLCKGAPSSRLLERARCLKRTTERLQHQLDTQNVALSAKTTELESARREARELAATLEVSAAAAAGDGMVELGRARAANHDLALELARVSEISETLASDKEELGRRLGRAANEVRRCRAETEDVRECLRRAREELKGCREEASEAHASTREARELMDSARSREEQLLQELESAKRREAMLKEELAALSRAAERGKAMAERIEALQAELEACKAALSDERRQREQMSADRETSEEALRRARQSLSAMRGVEQEKGSLEGLLERERALGAALRGDKDAVREQLKVALAEREELVRGLRQAKTYNDQLAKDKYIAEGREREACARFSDARDGKHALQRALLEQLAVARGALREERERRLEAEAALQTLTANAAAGERTTPSRTRVSETALDEALTSDSEDSVSLEEGDAVLSSPLLQRPRDTLVQDYLGREDAEQFLSDWDEERSSTSESESCGLSQPLPRSSPSGVTTAVDALAARQPGWELARLRVERRGIAVASSTRKSARVPETTGTVAAAVPEESVSMEEGAHPIKGSFRDLAQEEGVAAGLQQALLSSVPTDERGVSQDRQAREAHRNSDGQDASAAESAPNPRRQEQEVGHVGTRGARGRAARLKDDSALNDFPALSPAEASAGVGLDEGGSGRSANTAEGGRPSPSILRRWRRRRAGGGGDRGTSVVKGAFSEGIVRNDGPGLSGAGTTDGGDSGETGASSCAGDRGEVVEERRKEEETLSRPDVGRRIRPPRLSLLDVADQSIEDIYNHLSFFSNSGSVSGGGGEGRGCGHG